MHDDYDGAIKHLSEASSHMGKALVHADNDDYERMRTCISAAKEQATIAVSKLE